MKKLLVALGLLAITSPTFAALTVGNIPQVKTGGSTPALQNSIVSQSGTTVTVGGTLSATALSGPLTGNVTGNADTASNASAVEGTDTGTLTDTNVCRYDLAGTEIDCNLTTDGSGDCGSGAVCLGDHTHAAAYQPLESTLTDIADGTIAEDLVNTANPWADNEVADTITASSYMPLAGGAFTGPVTLYSNAAPTTDAAGECAFDSDAWTLGAPECFDGTNSIYMIGTLASDAPGNGQVPKWNTGGTITWEDDTQSAGSATAWDDIADPDADATLAFGGFEQLITASLDAASKTTLTINNTDDDKANAITLLKLADDDTGDAEVTYLSMIKDYDGTPTADFTFNQSTGFTSLLPIIPPAEAYDATNWDADTGAPQKDAVRDKLEAMPQTAGDHITLTGTDLDIDDDFLLNNGDVGTGVYDFGGATSVEIPNAADPGIDAAGEIAVDTTSDHVEYYGGAKRVLGYQRQFCFSLETPVDADDNVPIYFPREPITVTDVYCEVDGGTSVAMTISDGTNALEAITCDADGAEDDGSIANGTFTANERVEIDLASTSGTNTWLAGCVTYVLTED